MSNNSTPKTLMNPIPQILANQFIQSFPEDAGIEMSYLEKDDIKDFVGVLDREMAARLLEHTPLETAVSVLLPLSRIQFLNIVSKMDSYRLSLILGKIDEEIREEKLSWLPEKLSGEIQDILAYQPNTAGYMMDRKFTSFSAEQKVEDVLALLRKNKNPQLLDFFVTSSEETLVGNLTLRDVAMANPDESIGNIMHTQLLSVSHLDNKEEIIQLMDSSKLTTVPVVDIENRLLGIIPYGKIVDVAQSKSGEDIKALFGVSPEEKALSKPWFSIKKRLPWLQINLATGFLASAVVGLFENTISKITFLAILLPIVAGQSGNTGSQALAVTIRGLALREIRPSHWLRICLKEFKVGFINGSAVAIVTSLGVYIWSKSFAMSFVIGTCMVFSMVVAGISGALTPICLKMLRQDPATSSSIILTTITDVVGFASFLGLATIMSQYLIIS